MLGAALCKKFKIFEEKGAQGESVGIVIWVAIKKKIIKNMIRVHTLLIFFYFYKKEKCTQKCAKYDSYHIL